MNRFVQAGSHETKRTRAAMNRRPCTGSGQRAPGAIGKGYRLHAYVVPVGGSAGSRVFGQETVIQALGQLRD